MDGEIMTLIRSYKKQLDSCTFHTQEDFERYEALFNGYWAMKAQRKSNIVLTFVLILATILPLIATALLWRLL